MLNVVSYILARREVGDCLFCDFMIFCDLCKKIPRSTAIDQSASEYQSFPLNGKPVEDNFLEVVFDNSLSKSQQ